MTALITYLKERFQDDVSRELNLKDMGEFSKKYELSNYAESKRCYRAFCKAKKGETDKEALCLQLSSYLAYWGMFRGSSFLIKCNSGVHQKAVEILLQEKYTPLFGARLEECTENMAQLVWELGKELQEDAYPEYNPSDTLITKIMQGAVACIPAYDINVKKAFSNLNLQKCFPVASARPIYQMYDVCRKGNPIETSAVKGLGLKIPDMQILDFILFHYGKNLYEEASGR